MMKKLLVSLLGGTLLATSSIAADVKIGFVTTLTTPAAVIGKDMENAVNLAIEHLGGKAGAHNLEVVFGDDGFAPDTGKQVTDRLVKQDNVDIVAGYIWSHVLLASRKSVLDAGKILISSNAGPSQMAGKLCDQNFFSASWQNDQTPMAMGEVLNKAGVKVWARISQNGVLTLSWISQQSWRKPKLRVRMVFLSFTQVPQRVLLPSNTTKPA
jgi:branched-chain amino acid transport system substrate-binding protein